MNKVLGAAIAGLVVVGGYFGLSAAGIIGVPKVMSDEEVTAGLTAYADQINVEGGLRFDDFSKLTRATAVSKTITIRGESTLNIADLGDSYHASRADQGANILCNDPVTRELLRGSATVNFNWFSADDESVGDMITIRGDEVCADYE